MNSKSEFYKQLSEVFGISWKIIAAAYTKFCWGGRGGGMTIFFIYHIREKFFHEMRVGNITTIMKLIFKGPILYISMQKDTLLV